MSQPKQWLTVLAILIAGLVTGCSKDSKPTGPGSVPAEDPKPPLTTQITFVMQTSGTSYKLYVDGNEKGILSSQGQEVTVEVEPEDHTFYVIDEGCTKLTSRQVTLSILGGQTLNIKISNTYPGFDFKTISRLSASDGDYTESVKLSWNDLNKNRAPKYEISRKTSSGSYSHLATVTGTSYIDNSVAKTTLYSYRVRAVWPCMNGSWSSSNSGYSKSAKFYNTRIELDDPNHSIYIRTDIKLYGFDDHVLMFGGYWYRKRFGVYYYQNAECNTNVPNNYIGHIWGYWLHGDISTLNSWFKVDWDCFKEKTGTYYGKIKLYNTSLVIHPNDATLAQSAWVSFQWVSGVSGAGDSSPQYKITILDEFEASLLEADMFKSGVEQEPTEGFVSDIPFGSSSTFGATSSKLVEELFDEHIEKEKR